MKFRLNLRYGVISVVKHFGSVLQRGSYRGEGGGRGVLRAPANSSVWECDFNGAVRQLY